MSLMQKFMDHTSWTLQRVSSKTFPLDITGRCKDSPQPADEVAQMIKQGHCFRARIAKEPFCFASNTEIAMELAIKQHKELHAAAQDA